MESKKLYRTVSAKLEMKEAGIVMQLAGEKNMTVSSFLKMLITKEAEREKSLELNFKGGGKVDSSVIEDIQNELGDALANNDGLKETVKKKEKKIKELTALIEKKESIISSSVSKQKYEQGIKEMLEACNNEKLMIREIKDNIVRDIENSLNDNVVSDFEFLQQYNKDKYGDNKYNYDDEYKFKIGLKEYFTLREQIKTAKDKLEEMI